MAEVALRDYVNEIDGMIENSAFDVAIQHCRHILSLYPKYLEVYRVLGKALLEKDDYGWATSAATFPPAPDLAATVAPLTGAMTFPNSSSARKTSGSRSRPT